MPTSQIFRILYQEAKYREMVKLREVIKSISDEELLYLGWAHHQLGEYQKSIAIFEKLSNTYSSSSEIGESSRRGLAHGLLQSGGDLSKVDEIMEKISSFDLKFDNLYINQILIKARKGEKIPVQNVFAKIITALSHAPYETVNGHIINNGALALHEARKQEDVKPYLPVLPSLIMMAIDIYEATGAAKNHIAGALFRASQIFEVAGNKEKALEKARDSVRHWREIVFAQGGDRYGKNLTGAVSQLEKLKK